MKKLWQRTGWCGAAGLVLAYAGCSRPAPAPQPPKVAADVLATVGEEPITTGQFMAAAARRRLGDDPKARESLLDEMMRFRALVQEAKRRGYDRDPQVVAAYESLLANRVRETAGEQARAQSKVDPAETEAYYREHLTEFTVPTKVRAAVIYVEAPASFSAEARAERRTAVDTAREKSLALPKNVGNFGAVAAEYSYDQATKYRGGDMGYLTEGAKVQGWEKPVVEAAFALKDFAQISEVISTDRGFYLVKLSETQPGSVQPLEKMRPQIERRLAAAKERTATIEKSDEIVGHWPVKVFKDRLAALPAPDPRQSADAKEAPPAIPAE